MKRRFVSADAFEHSHETAFHKSDLSGSRRMPFAASSAEAIAKEDSPFAFRYIVLGYSFWLLDSSSELLAVDNEVRVAPCNRITPGLHLTSLLAVDFLWTAFCLLADCGLLLAVDFVYVDCRLPTSFCRLPTFL